MPRPVLSSPAVRSGVALAALLALAGCGSSVHKDPVQQNDPAMTAAIEAPIMTDPDLSAMNARLAALSPGGPADGSLPTLDLSADERAAAADEAATLAGGRLEAPPPAQQLDAPPALTGVSSLAERAQALLGHAACLTGATGGMAWGAKAPPQLPVYPRAHLREALGNDAPGCKLRAMSVVAAIPAEDVIDFYATMARKAGFTPVLGRDSERWVLEGHRASGDATFAVLVRNGEPGQIVVDLFTLGL